MSKKILIVDDSALMRRVMCDIINSDERFQVIEQATDGEKAYELLKKNTYDGVVLDVNMPKMDGIQLLQMLQKDKIRARIMMASTDTKEGASVTMEALELGAIDFIEKPANILYLRGNDFKTRFLDILKAVVSSPQTNIPRESAVSIKKSEESTRKLDHLQGKYILCTASNGPYEQQICRLKKADMLKDFDHCFVSEKIGVDKPDVRFFERCLEQLPGIRAEKCMIIGDSLTADIAGGQAAGMETCWFCREKMEESELENVRRTHKADHVIKRLEELKDLL